MIRKQRPNSPERLLPLVSQRLCSLPVDRDNWPGAIRCMFDLERINGELEIRNVVIVPLRQYIALLG